MDPTQSVSQQIHRLLLENTVLSLKQLRVALNDRPRSSLFRDLTKLDLISSYTHTGQYHALKQSATFDKNDLWFFQEIGFSRYGTLKKTLVRAITDAPAGLTHQEMKARFRVEVQKPLTHLVNTHAVTRELLPSRIYVYLSANEMAQEQFQRRLAMGHRALDAALPPESIRIEVLVEVIRAADRTVDEDVLGPLLRHRGIPIKDEVVGYVLAYYDIKKNGY